MNILKETIEDVGPRPGQFTTTRLWFGCGEFQCEYIRHKIYSLSIGILLTPAFSFFLFINTIYTILLPISTLFKITDLHSFITDFHTFIHLNR